MEEPVIEINSLVKNFKSNRALDGLSLNVFEGDVFGFLGPNGAGKSTTIRILLSLVKADSGSVKIFGESMPSSRLQILRRTGCIIEQADFYVWMTARKNLEILGAGSGKMISKKRIDEVIELVGLRGRENEPVKNFSHGMRQRLGLAQTLLHDPELIILDEPTTGLDPQGIIDIRNLIQHLSRDLGKTVFLSSHLLSEIELIATRLAIVNRGKTLVEGSAAELLNADERIVRFELSNEPQALALIESSVWKNKKSENEFSFRLSRKETSELNQFFVANNLSVFRIESRQALEDYYLKITNNHVVADSQN